MAETEVLIHDEPLQLAIALSPTGLLAALDCLTVLNHLPRELVFNRKSEDFAMLFVELWPADDCACDALLNALRVLPVVSSVEILDV